MSISHRFALGKAWEALRIELDAWSEAGLIATFWWRDDDARTHTPALERLLQLAEAHSTPVALAVIPMSCERSLEMRVRHEPRVAILQHGIRHVNRAPATLKKVELWEGCDPEQVRDELRAGVRRLASLFARPLPVLVPPWNRIGGNHLQRLHESGFRGLSTFGPRQASSDVRRVNCHVDPIGWRHDRRFVGEEAALRQVLAHLRARRLANSDRDEPTGLLSHHLVHDESTWRFIQNLLAETGAHPVCRWLTAEETFALPCD
ncbi:MAG: polysaccharide deacetylase family protein [Gammaproteobacteria bacterium]|nr:polysaccharide deacetylase family protein [Gammaproteobacteria bacterium]